MRPGRVERRLYGRPTATSDSTAGRSTRHRTYAALGTAFEMPCSRRSIASGFKDRRHTIKTLGAATSRLRALAETEHIEGSHAVSLCPDAERARPGNVSIIERDHGLAIEQHVNSGAPELDTNKVPGSGRHRRVDVLQGSARPARGVVQGDIVFQRVRSEE